MCLFVHSIEMTRAMGYTQQNETLGRNRGGIGRRMREQRGGFASFGSLSLGRSTAMTGNPDRLTDYLSHKERMKLQRGRGVQHTGRRTKMRRRRGRRGRRRRGTTIQTGGFFGAILASGARMAASAAARAAARAAASAAARAAARAGARALARTGARALAKAGAKALARTGAKALARTGARTAAKSIAKSGIGKMARSVARRGVQKVMQKGLVRGLTKKALTAGKKMVIKQLKKAPGTIAEQLIQQASQNRNGAPDDVATSRSAGRRPLDRRGRLRGRQGRPLGVGRRGRPIRQRN